MNRQYTSADPTKLSYAVRLPVIFKYVGQLGFISAVLSLAPFICSLIYQEYAISLRFVIAIACFLLLGLLTLKIAIPEKIQTNEALTVISLAFVVSSFVLTIPMMGSGLSFMDAWFEVVSGLTTTGLSIAGGMVQSKTFLFSRAFLQWYGGIGIVIFSLGLAMQPSMAAKKLGGSIASSEDLVSSTRVFSRYMLSIYGILSLACLLLLWFTGPSLFDAIVHMLASVSTGGFSTSEQSLTAFPIGFQMTVTAFTFLSAIAFPLFWITKMKHFRNFFANYQLIGLTCCALLSSFLVFLTFGIKNGDTLWQAVFNAFSAQTTAGFSTVPIGELNPAAKLILMASMSIGGSIQSTAGGFKIIRLLILFKIFQLIFIKTSTSQHTVVFSQFGGFKLSAEEKESCFSIIFLFVFTVFISWICFAFAGYDPLNSLFEVTSAAGTVGLSTGVSHSSLPAYLKAVLCFDMFLGRLEFVTFLTLFYPRTLVGRRRSS